ncbi:hypothetical protein GY45DRAFT_767836 [Cubamyces sp. BRFM 1775]|nr:hypothetical protein GY45DRAFT_767836 [Cubamyces sp. BRFM 1775]
MADVPGLTTNRAPAEPTGRNNDQENQPPPLPMRHLGNAEEGEINSDPKLPDPVSDIESVEGDDDALIDRPTTFGGRRLLAALLTNPGRLLDSQQRNVAEQLFAYCDLFSDARELRHTQIHLENLHGIKLDTRATIRDLADYSTDHLDILTDFAWQLREAVDTTEANVCCYREAIRGAATRLLDRSQEATEYA